MSLRETVRVVGVDGSPDGWVAVSATNGRFVELAAFPDIATLAAGHSRAAVIAIDIPTSCPRGGEPRAADLEARRRLGRSGSSLFFAPPRDVLERVSYAEANRYSRSAYGRGISAQSYALRRKILEVAAFLEATGETRIHEVHPELSFRYLAESLGKDVSSSKKTWRGFVERREMLERVGLAPPLEPGSRLGRAAPDDVLDAAVAAWSAHRIATKAAEALGRRAHSASPAGLIHA